jgi:hypothetical protein
MPNANTWGSLPRTLNDSETISEHVAGELATHNADDSAHGQSDEAIYNHRIAEILDHLDGSVSLEKLTNDKNIFWSSWQNIDGWTNSSGLITPSILNMRIYTTDVINNESYLEHIPTVMDYISSIGFSPFFQTTARLSSQSNQLAYITCGSYKLTALESYFGFKFSNDKVYATTSTVAGGLRTEHNTEITGIYTSDFHTYRANYNPTSVAIDFYIDGILKHSEDTDIPNTDMATMMCFYLKTTTTAIKNLYSTYLFFQASITSL